MSSIRRQSVRATGATLAALAMLGSPAGASIAPVRSFGRQGSSDLGPGKVLAVAAQRRGGLVAVGYSGGRMLVERISSGGRVEGRSNAGPGVANAVVVQDDGKIVVAGTTAGSASTPQAGDMVIERFNASGSVDRRFGHGGVAHLRGAVANALALGPRGTIVAGGSLPGRDGSPRVALARLKSSGQPDGALGAGGLAVVDLGPFSEANAVAVQGDGKIVFAGDAGQQILNGIVGRLAGRSLDRRFATNGVFNYGHPHGGAAASFTAVSILSGGRILAAGSDAENAGSAALFVRLVSNGRPDGGFGSGGSFVTPSSSNAGLTGLTPGARAMVVTRGGEIIAAGVYQVSARSYATVWSLTSRGRLDGRQGRGGVTRTTAGGVLGAVYQGVALVSGDLYAGGDTVGVSQTRALVSRYALRGVR